MKDPNQKKYQIESELETNRIIKLAKLRKENGWSKSYVSEKRAALLLSNPRKLVDHNL